MQYELTVTMQLSSRRSQDCVAKMFKSHFEYGTTKESIAEGLQILDDPRLLSVTVKRKVGGNMLGSAFDVF
jgi:hypothetical protein